jgi:hypothetical protein
MRLLLLLFLLSSPAYSHELTPAYPKLVPSFIEGLATTKVVLFNRRQDVEYYELEVYDSKWTPVSFASQSKVIQAKYLDRVAIDIYIRSKDSKKAMYICTTSKLKTQDVKYTAVSSRVCSKIK